MKKLNIVLLSTVVLSSLGYAGGDILPPVYENEIVEVPIEEVPVEEAPIEEYVEPVVVAPKPKSIPVVVPKPVENIIPLGLYVGLGLTAGRYDPKCGCTTSKGDPDKTAGLIGRLGYDFNQYVGLEARGIRTNWKSDGGKIKHYGVFLKPMYPLSRDFNLYGLAGYAKTTTQGIKRHVDAETFAWGAGVEYDLASDVPKEGRYSRTFDGYGDQEGGWGLFADYERLVQKSGSPDLDTVNFGITYDF